MIKHQLEKRARVKNDSAKEGKEEEKNLEAKRKGGGGKKDEIYFLWNIFFLFIWNQMKN